MVGYRRFTLTILLTLALSLGNFAFALPTTGSSTLEGRVFQSDLKTPAPDLGVQVIPSGSEKVAATGSTDSRGHFEIANVPAGEILLVLVDGTGRAVGASRIDTRAAPSRALTLALPDPGARLQVRILALGQHPRRRDRGAARGRSRDRGPGRQRPRRREDREGSRPTGQRERTALIAPCASRDLEGERSRRGAAPPVSARRRLMCPSLFQTLDLAAE